MHQGLHDELTETLAVGDKEQSQKCYTWEFEELMQRKTSTHYISKK